jgi:hypothetical protein
MTLPTVWQDWVFLALAALFAVLAAALAWVAWRRDPAGVKALAIGSPVAVALFSAMALLAALITHIFHSTAKLSSGEWCAQALNAERLTNAGEQEVRIDAMTACIGLLTRQVKAVALDSHMTTGALSMGFLILVAVVLARAKFDFTVSKTGASASVSRDASRAAHDVADAAEEKAGEISERN